MDRSWMQLRNRRSPQYIDGVREFILFARDHMKPETDKIWCPCYRCNNHIQKTIEEVEIHLYAYGVVTSYTRWVYHGEGFELNDNDDSQNENDEYLDNVIEKSNSPNTEVREVIHDIRSGTTTFGYVGEASSSRNPNLPSSCGGETNKFARLMRDAEQDLYPDCQRFSKLSFMVKLLHLKIFNRWSNKSLTMLLELLKEALPIGETLPCSYNEAKQIIRDLGLDYQKIHVCKNDCVLFWKEYENEDECPTCKAPRYKVRKGKGKGRKIPHKVLRYFPLKPRLQRLFISRKTAIDMKWHKDKRVEEENVLRHPADSEAWKDFDKKHESFAKDPRNVRLGLASDGFNPFGNMSNSYSIWPVFLVPYNLPPWKCMKDPFFMMPLLIPGRRAPGFDFDVFLQPLIDELKELWEVGVETYDASNGQSFQLRAALLWTINDFPAYGNLSGWSTKGKLACPSCNEDASHQYLHHWKKTCYTGHRRFLPHNHVLRKSKAFNGEPEHRSEPKLLSGEEVLGQLEHLDSTVFGKIDERGKKRKRSPQYLNWTRRSIFFELPYWKTLKVRHNLDVMHIEKNVCDSVMGTLMNVDGKTKDSYKARLDLVAMGIRPELHPRQVDGKTYLPTPCFMLSPTEKRSFCEFLSTIKLPDGYASNISHCVSTSDCRITGLKSHDCHVILQRLLPVALRGCLKKDVSKALIELCLFFKELSAKTLRVDVLEQLEKDIVLILCKLEKIFPPSFFDIMIHLCVHLSREAILAGPVQYRWMYAFERYMHILKGYVRNKARPEGSIAEGYIDNEALTFCSMYFNEGETKFNRPERNYDGPIKATQDGNISVFKQKVRGIGAAVNDVLNLKDLKKARWYVLNNCDEVQPYVRQYMDELERQGLRNVQERLESEFHTWFLKYVTKQQLEGTMDASNQLMNLARGPDSRVTRYSGCIINGTRFHTQDRDMNRKTQNSGVVVKGDHKGEAIDFYGVVRDIVELKYLGRNRVFLFKCDWWDVGNEKNGMKFDDYKYVSVNVTRTWYKDEPFVLACQAIQVFYMKDMKFGNNYRVVQRIIPRAIYDILVKRDEEEEKEEEEEKDNDEPYQEFESFGLGNAVHMDDQPIELCKEDMEMICVDIDGEFHEENLEDDEVNDDMIDYDSDDSQ